MVSNELMRRYPFFSCLTLDQMNQLGAVGEELAVEAGHYFFQEGDRLTNLYMVLEGNIDIAIGIPDRSVKQDISENILGNFTPREVTVSHVRPGQIFAWSALINPHVSTASARTTVRSRVIAFDCDELNGIFQDDCEFGYLMLQKVAGVIRQRLRDMRIQSLALTPSIT
jgi:CRP-like cAMP-binding protein